MNPATAAYRLKPSSLARIVMGRWLGRWWWALAVLPVAALVGACFDLRWAIVALMFLFVIAPFALMIVYYNYLLKPSMVAMTRRQSAEIDGKTLRFKEISDEENACEARCRSLAMNPGIRLAYTSKMLVVELSDSPDGFVAIPLDAFDGDDEKQIEMRRNDFITALIKAVE